MYGRKMRGAKTTNQKSAERSENETKRNQRMPSETGYASGNETLEKNVTEALHMRGWSNNHLQQHVQKISNQNAVAGRI
jgi:hypothetical protein